MDWTKNTGRVVRLVVTLGAMVAAVGCREDTARLPLAQSETVAARVEAGLAISSLNAAAGDRIAVAVWARSEEALGGVQGYIRFDPAALRYVGQPLSGQTLALVNAQAADRGELQVLSLNTNGLDERSAVLAFEVRRGNYARALRYELSEAVTRDVREVAAEFVSIAPEPVVVSDLAAGDPRVLSVEDWGSFLYPKFEERGDPIMPVPGQYLLNLRYGDPNLNGAITVSDVLYIANVAVGNNQVIVGTDAPARDAVVAGNVRPSNLPGLGEPTDAVPPGQEANGTRVLSVSDALAIATEAVGTDVAITGDLVPGRGPIPTDTVFVPAGNISTNTTWTKNHIYVLQGIVKVNGGATLTIEAGTRIEGVTTVLSALFIERDAWINAQGTALEPIVMTCVAPVGGGLRAQGCWGGFSVAGNAPINAGDPSLGLSPAIKNSAAGCGQRNGEGAVLIYGGCDPADSSGVVRYVRSEHGGFVRALNDELNSMTFMGVGNRTVVDFIQVHSGQDDGFEIFGGTFNLKHLYVTANSDDGFDYAFGWNGKAQYIIIQQDSLDGDKGFEVDNGDVDAGVPLNSVPRVNPTIFNVTLVGQRDSANGGGNSVNDGLHLRRGMASQIRNLLAISFTVGLDLDDAQTCVDINTATGLSIANSVFTRIHNLGNDDNDAFACGPYAAGTEIEEAFLLDPANNNSRQTTDSLLYSPYNVMLPDFRLNSNLVGATPPSDGFFTTTATHIGAVEARNGTGSNVPWYSGWTRGWQTSTTP